MLFNLVNFDPKTASESLLSAIYYAGFLMQPDHHEEVISYMQTYAICNIKKISFVAKLSSVQALGIYAYALGLTGNPSLSRLCLSHLFRIGDAIGVSIKRKNIPELDQYNRKIAYSEMLIYKNWTKLGASTYNTLSEKDDTDIDIYNPKYQLSSPNLSFHNNDHERTIYSIFCSELRKSQIQCVIVNNIICNYYPNRIDMEIDELNVKTNEIYINSKIRLEAMCHVYTEYKDLIRNYISLIKIPYLISTLGIHCKMIESHRNINFSTIEYIINKCTEIWGTLSKDKSLIHIWRYGPFTAAFHLIKVYPYSTKMQRETILFILRSIMDFYYKEGLDVNSIDFLILKTQADLYENI